jgi:hypothetical protein
VYCSIFRYTTGVGQGLAQWPSLQNQEETTESKRMKVYTKLIMIMEEILLHLKISQSKYSLPHCNIHKYTWTFPNGKSHSQIDHILRERRRHSSILDVRLQASSNDAPACSLWTDTWNDRSELRIARRARKRQPRCTACAEIKSEVSESSTTARLHARWADNSRSRHHLARSPTRQQLPTSASTFLVQS